MTTHMCLGDCNNQMSVRNSNTGWMTQHRTGYAHQSVNAERKWVCIHWGWHPWIEELCWRKKSCDALLAQGFAHQHAPNVKPDCNPVHHQKPTINKIHRKTPTRMWLYELHRLYGYSHVLCIPIISLYYLYPYCLKIEDLSYFMSPSVGGAKQFAQSLADWLNHQPDRTHVHIYIVYHCMYTIYLYNY